MFYRFWRYVSFLAFVALFTYQELYGCDLAKQLDDVGIDQIISSAKDGHSAAEAALGYAYYFGKGVPKDYQRAAEWFERAANNGNREAAFYLGGMYAKGLGTKESSQVAFHWYSVAAEKGDASAQILIGDWYATGIAVKQDIDSALRWYNAAAENKKPVAMIKFARLCFANGKKELFPAAVQWLKLAARKEPSARELLGYLFLQGRYIDKDLAEALKWFTIANEMDPNVKYKGVLADLEENIPTQSQLEVKENAKKWIMEVKVHEHDEGQKTNAEFQGK